MVRAPTQNFEKFNLFSLNTERSGEDDDSAVFAFNSDMNQEERP